MPQCLVSLLIYAFSFRWSTFLDSLPSVYVEARSGSRLDSSLRHSHATQAFLNFSKLISIVWFSKFSRSVFPVPSLALLPISALCLFFKPFPNSPWTTYAINDKRWTSFSTRFGDLFHEQQSPVVSLNMKRCKKGWTRETSSLICLGPFCQRGWMTRWKRGIQMRWRWRRGGKISSFQGRSSGINNRATTGM